MFLWDWIIDILAYFKFNRKANMVFIGLDNAGKSTLLRRLKDGRMTQNPPTAIPVSDELTIGKITFKTYDLGGHKQARRVWKEYFVAVDAIVFLIDAADKDRFAESRAELDSLLSDDLVPNIPILVLGNKTDLKKAVGQDELIRIFGVNIYLTGKKKVPRGELNGRPLELFMCSILNQTGYGQAFRWLADYV